MLTAKEFLVEMGITDGDNKPLTLRHGKREIELSELMEKYAIQRCQSLPLGVSANISGSDLLIMVERANKRNQERDGH